jgi:hypothetical protein
MANDNKSIPGGAAGTPTTTVKHGPYPKGPLGENPANTHVVSAGEPVDSVHNDAHEATNAVSASIRLGQLKALHAAAIRQGNTDEVARLAVEIAALEAP